MRYLFYLLTSICLLVLLGCLVYFLLLALITIATLLEGLLIFLSLFLALAGVINLRRTLRIFQQKQIALATVIRLTLDARGKKTYQLQFTTRNDQTILAEISAENSSFESRLWSFFLDLFDAQPTRGSRFPLLYDVHIPDKNFRRLSFATLWLGPILLFWFSVLLLLFGLTLWLSC